MYTRAFKRQSCSHGVIIPRLLSYLSDVGLRSVHGRIQVLFDNISEEREVVGPEVGWVKPNEPPPDICLLLSCFSLIYSILSYPSYPSYSILSFLPSFPSLVIPILQKREKGSDAVWIDGCLVCVCV